MTGLLIHSVAEFSDLILEALKLADAKNIIEIGAEYGGMSALLAAYCRARGGQFTTVDPAPKREFHDWLSANPDVRHLAKPSLEAFDDIATPMPGSSMATTTGTPSITSSAKPRRSAAAPASRFWSFFTTSAGRAGDATPIMRPNGFRRNIGSRTAMRAEPRWIMKPWSGAAASAAWATSHSRRSPAARATV